MDRSRFFAFWRINHSTAGDDISKVSQFGPQQKFAVKRLVYFLRLCSPFFFRRKSPFYFVSILFLGFHRFLCQNPILDGFFGYQKPGPRHGTHASLTDHGTGTLRLRWTGALLDFQTHLGNCQAHFCLVLVEVWWWWGLVLLTFGAKFWNVGKHWNSWHFFRLLVFGGVSKLMEINSNEGFSALPFMIDLGKYTWHG